MDIDGKLVFSQPHDGTGHLVFGDGGAEVIPAAEISLDCDLPGLGVLTLHTGAVLGFDAELPGLDGSIDLAWDANVSRGMRHETRAGWNDGIGISHGVQAIWEQGVIAMAGVRSQWREGGSESAFVAARWEESERLRNAVSTDWQEGLQERALVAMHWEESERLRSAVSTAWQEGLQERALVATHWEESERLRSAVSTDWQEGLQERSLLHSRFGDGQAIRVPLASYWQEAMWPASGVSARPVDPAEPSCFDPATVGKLVFSDAFTGDGRLVFVCQRGGGLPPATVVVAARRSYIVVNSVEIRRVDALGGAPLLSDGFQAKLDRQSWTWSWSANFHSSARAALESAPGADPVEVEARVNGQPFRLLVERISKAKRFPAATISVSGRGIAARLEPKMGLQTFSQALDRTALQLMTEALTLNGVSIGWGLDFKLEDWLIPGGVWMHQGSWVSALSEIAGAVGGYLQPHDTEQIMRVLPAWPAPWWEWNTMTPDLELPAGIAEVEDIEIIEQPNYNRIFVSGDAGGITADLTRAGTAGDMLRQPMVVHPLITTIGAAKARARAEIAEVSGTAITQKMTLPVLPATGVIKPGVKLRYTDAEAVQRMGIVRSVSLASNFPVLTQALEVASHV